MRGVFIVFKTLHHVSFPTACQTCTRLLTNKYIHKMSSLPNQQRAPYKSFTRRRNFEYLIPEDNDSHGSREIVNSVK